MSLSSRQVGYLAAGSAYLSWGLFPLYWTLIGHIPALEIMLHRILWCFVFVAGLLTASQGLDWLRQAWQDKRTLWQLGASGAVMSLNWYIYIWAVTNEHIVETSLGYYINPLVNVALATLVLKERLNGTQKLAVAIAALGVSYLAWDFGRIPWISLALAGTFACYGFIRRQTQIAATSGLALEGLMMLPLALTALAALQWQGQAQLMTADARTWTLVLLGGAVTAIPLILFAIGARRIPYSAVGMLQYIGPSVQLFLAVQVFDEAFDSSRLLGFACVWVALAIYTTDALRRFARSSG